MKKIWIAGLFVLTTGITAVSQEDEGVSVQTKLNAGASLKDGNTRSVTANISLLSELDKPGFGSIRAGAEGNYGESKVDGRTDTSIEDVEAFINARKTISPMTFGYAENSVLYDYIARIDYRVTLGPGVGAYLVKRDDFSLSVETGPSYIWTKEDRVRDDYVAARFAERLDYQISETSGIWQSVEYMPRIDDFGDFLLNFELGIEAAINARTSLRLVLKDKYNSTPGEGLKKNDLSLIAGLSLLLSQN